MKTNNLYTINKVKRARYKNLMSTEGFKSVFGWWNPSPWLLDFANEVIDQKKVLSNMQYESGDTFIYVPTPTKRLSYDLLCKADPQTLLLIERANYQDKNFEQRVMNRLSNVVTNCKAFGGNPKYNYFININIANFIVHKKSPDYIHYTELRYGRTSDYDIFKVILELPKFNKSLKQLETEQDKWLYLLKHAHELHKRPAEFSSEVFKRLFEDPYLRC